MSRERDAVQAAQLWTEVTQSVDPGRLAERIIDRLEHQAKNAEARQISEEKFLAQAVERMERAAHARQREPPGREPNSDGSKAYDDARWNASARTLAPGSATASDA